MIFVDTGFFIGLMNERDELHTRAESWWGHLRDREQLVVTEYVLWEVINAQSARARRAQLHALLDFVRGSDRFETVAAEGTLYAKGLALHRARTDKDWSLTDCISFEVMRERGIVRALTHDQHFEQAGFEALVRRDP